MPRKNPRSLDGIPTTPDPEPNQPANAEHNMKARADIMREGAAELDRIDKERADLNESASKVRERFKNTGISAKEVEVVRRWRKQEEGDRAQYLENVKEAMAALGLGEQGSLFVAANGDAPEDTKDIRPRFLQDGDTPAATH